MKWNYLWGRNDGTYIFFANVTTLAYLGEGKNQNQREFVPRQKNFRCPVMINKAGQQKNKIIMKTKKEVLNDQDLNAEHQQ